MAGRISSSSGKTGESTRKASPPLRMSTLAVANAREVTAMTSS
jgi:hypothetical protein